MASSASLSGIRGWAALPLILSLALAAPARADEAYEVSAADRETARGLMDLGRDKYAEGAYDEALAAFEKADAIMGVTSTGLWVGKALMKTGRLIEARDKLIAVRAIPKQANESDILSIARDEAEKLQLEIADRIPEISIAVSGLHEGAELRITVDDRVVSTEHLVLPRKVNPGKHIIRASSPGYTDLEVHVMIGEATREKVALAFVKSDGTSAVTPQPVPDTTDSGDAAGPNIPMWVCFGIAGAGILAGSITGGLSLAEASSARDGCDGDDCGPGQGDPDAADTSLTLAHVSTVSFIVGGLAAGAGLVFLLLDDDGASEGAWSPLLGPGYVGVTGRF